MSNLKRRLKRRSVRHKVQTCFVNSAGDGLEAECDSAASSLQCVKSVGAGCLQWCRLELKVAVMAFNPETMNWQPMHNGTCVFKWRAPQISHRRGAGTGISFNHASSL